MVGTIAPQDSFPDWVTIETTTTATLYIVEPPPINTVSATLQGQLLEIVYAALNNLGSLDKQWFAIQVDPDLVTKQISISMTIPIKTSYPTGGEINIVAETEFIETVSLSQDN